MGMEKITARGRRFPGGLEKDCGPGIPGNKYGKEAFALVVARFPHNYRRLKRFQEN
jgi:hypothetical protein